MKRASMKWLESQFDDAMGGSPGEFDMAKDILDSDARQRAEIRRLRKALLMFVDTTWKRSDCDEREWTAIQALAPKRRARK